MAILAIWRGTRVFWRPQHATRPASWALDRRVWSIRPTSRRNRPQTTLRAPRTSESSRFRAPKTQRTSQATYAVALGDEFPSGLATKAAVVSLGTQLRSLIHLRGPPKLAIGERVLCRYFRITVSNFEFRISKISNFEFRNFENSTYNNLPTEKFVAEKRSAISRPILQVWG